jgi:acyl-CoA synthetase (AMP-forming)/AMP-acid ligase II
MRPLGDHLLDVVERHAERDPDAIVFRFLHRGDLDADVEELTRGALLHRARSLAAVIADATAPGDRVLVLVPAGLDTLVAFFACLHAGVLPVLMTPPDAVKVDRSLERLARIVARSGASLVVTRGEVIRAADPLLRSTPALVRLRWVAVDAVDAAPSPRRVPIRAEAPAFLQFTSGSLGAPRGVVVTQQSLLANLDMLRVGMVADAGTPGVSWLPLFHDMGLICGALLFAYVGSSATLFSPGDFIHRPVRWLRAITRYGGVIGGAPCFAYERCARRVPDDELAGLDLRTWRTAYCGAEPVRAATVDRFCQRFAPVGFRREFFFPCYGLAEATLYVSGKPMSPPAAPRVLSLSAAALERDRIEVLPASDPAARPIVSCGIPAEGTEVVIASLHGDGVARPGEVGEICLRGPHVAAGYWDDVDATAVTFGRAVGEGTPRLATGDLGFVDGGELFLTGRLKEVLKLSGRNLYPDDLEATVEAAHDDLRLGGSAAFSLERDDEEVLAVVAELRDERCAGGAWDDVTRAVRAALLREHGVSPRELVFVRPGGLAKTTSGKKARAEMRRRLLAQRLDRVGP